MNKYYTLSYHVNVFSEFERIQPYRSYNNILVKHTAYVSIEDALNAMYESLGIATFSPKLVITPARNKILFFMTVEKSNCDGNIVRHEVSFNIQEHTIKSVNFSALLKKDS